MKRILFLLMLGAIGAFFVRQFCIEAISVASASMEPTLPSGMTYFVNKMVYFFRAPQRGEIVVLPSPVDTKKDLIKRVIAIGGDILEINNKKVSLNGKELSESYVRHTRKDEILYDDNLGPLVVPEAFVFLMGDNRDESGDSRDWKDKDGKYIYSVPIKKIKGKVMN